MAAHAPELSSAALTGHVLVVCPLVVRNPMEYRWRYRRIHAIASLGSSKYSQEVNCMFQWS